MLFLTLKKFLFFFCDFPLFHLLSFHSEAKPLSFSFFLPLRAIMCERERELERLYSMCMCIDIKLSACVCE